MHDGAINVNTKFSGCRFNENLNCFRSVVDVVESICIDFTLLFTLSEKLTSYFF